jgi:hypothetical protein
MRLDAVDTASLALLDKATDGLFSLVLASCEATGATAHLTVQTSLDGLPEDAMKLYIQVVSEDGQIEDWAAANLHGRELLKLGWNLYLNDKLESARSYVKRANQRVQAQEARELLH